MVDPPRDLPLVLVTPEEVCSRAEGPFRACFLHLYSQDLTFRSLSFCSAEEHPIGDITAPQARPPENMWAGAILLHTYT